MSQVRSYDAIIIGGGAAGLMCAIEAGRRDRSVLIIDHANKVGNKILISGGGHCNFTNWGAEPADYQSGNPQFCISALSRYTPKDFLTKVESHNIPYHEKTLGQLFCDGSSTEILNMLTTEAMDAAVTTIVNCTVNEISRKYGFMLKTNKGDYTCESLIIATGGPSIPQMGATRYAYEVAKNFGMKVTDINPGLVPLRFRGEHEVFCRNLSGVSIPSSVSCRGITFKENILFTHRGMSGPAILQISSYWKQGQPININLLPDIDVDNFLLSELSRRPKGEVPTILSSVLPRNFARAFCNRYQINKPINQLSSKDLLSLSNKLTNWELSPSSTQGYRMAEVSLGGVDTGELSSRTMESTTVNSLYFIGEAVDVTGPLGGYNFQWAWASGYCAGQFV
ncbi:MAG: aminoacetone oxidase family FAD-binding enzyme [Dehalococcoidia bacterium]|nr:aminoacetone oxidase family FAD-binding enzyme [Dehalococcoidia bacterium]|tara:strand:+ start:4208 stop:5392 length:1185 start_codon:yes stop_codon:yes gene_type:complete